MNRNQVLSKFRLLSDDAMIAALRLGRKTNQERPEPTTAKDRWIRHRNEQLNKSIDHWPAVEYAPEWNTLAPHVNIHYFRPNTSDRLNKRRNGRKRLAIMQHWSRIEHI